MPYNYATEKPNVFKEENQGAFLKVRDEARRLFAIAGAARFDKIVAGIDGDNFLQIAFVDRLEEIGEINRISPAHVATQYRVYVKN